MAARRRTRRKKGSFGLSDFALRHPKFGLRHSPLGTLALCAAQKPAKFASHAEGLSVKDLTSSRMTESEWQTRKQRIDTRLRSVNPPWQIIGYREGLDLPALHCHAVGQADPNSH
jgi:hypothetical protein